MTDTAPVEHVARETSEIFRDLRAQVVPLCSRCRKPRDRQGQRYCAACHADYMRAWRHRRRRRDQLATIVGDVFNELGQAAQERPGAVQERPGAVTGVGTACTNSGGTGGKVHSVRYETRRRHG